MPIGVPRHVGFIMDGNRRWAKERGLTTPQGHKAGADNLERIVDECYAKAKDMLLENKDILENCAQLLLEKEKIGREEFEALFEA